MTFLTFHARARMMDLGGGPVAVAKNPGVGQGKGGGGNRPKRENMVRVNARLSAEAASLLDIYAKANVLPLWRVLDDLVKIALGGPKPLTLPELPPEAQEIAQECAAFLEAQENRAAALKALRRAWKQALALAHHDLAP